MLSSAAKKGSSSSRSQETTFKVESSIPVLQKLLHCSFFNCNPCLDNPPNCNKDIHLHQWQYRIHQSWQEHLVKTTFYNALCNAVALYREAVIVGHVPHNWHQDCQPFYEETSTRPLCLCTVTKSIEELANRLYGPKLTR